MVLSRDEFQAWLDNFKIVDEVIFNITFQADRSFDELFGAFKVIFPFLRCPFVRPSKRAADLVTCLIT
jgi:hypothetical protein